MNGRHFPARLKLRNAIITALGVGFSSLAMAIGLGPIEVNSYIGQPLDASIKVNGLSASAAERSSVSLASIADYQARGIEKLPTHDQLKFTLVPSGNGYVINVESKAGIREPFINFLLTMNGEGGTITREYAVFLNPNPAVISGVAPNETQVTPTATVTTTTATDNANVGGWGNVALSEAQPVALTPQENQTAQPNQTQGEAQLQATVGAYTGSTYGPVKAGETLYSIAKLTRPSESVSVNKMMNAIYKANRRAFASRNLNSLMAGYTLTIPDLQAVNSTTKSQVKKNTNQRKELIEQSVVEKPANLEEYNEGLNQSAESIDEIRQEIEPTVTDAEMVEVVAENVENIDALVADEMSEDITTDTMAATAEIAHSNQTQSNQADEEQEVFPVDGADEIPEEQDGVADEVLDGALLLDSPESFEQLPDANADLENENNISEDIAPAEEVQNEEPVQPLENTETVAPLEETAQQEAPVASPDVTAQAEAVNAQLDELNEPFLPLWMLALGGAFLLLLVLLLYKILRGKKAQTEEEMSEEEIQAMLATMEEEGQFANTLNFNELTENPDGEEFDDVSAQMQDQDIFQDDFQDDFQEEMFVNTPVAATDSETVDERHETVEEVDDFSTLDFDLSDMQTEETQSDVAESENLFIEDFSTDMDEPSFAKENELFADDTKESAFKEEDALFADEFIFDHSDENEAVNIEDEALSFETSSSADDMSSPFEDNSIDFDFDFEVEDETTGFDSSTLSSSSEFMQDDDLKLDTQEDYAFIDSEEDNNVSSIGDEAQSSENMEINLDLARSFIVTGNGDRAYDWLQEVIESGNEAQKAQARELLAQIKPKS